jgi:hypothetical protein
MLDLLEHDIRKAYPDRDIHIMDTALTTTITQLYNKELLGEPYEPEGNTWVQDFGRRLKKGSELAGIFHINKDHWVGSIADLPKEIIWYGDPTRKDQNDTVTSCIQWFASKHVPEVEPERFDTKDLDCTLQNLQYDWWQCGLLSPNALFHFFLPNKNPLLPKDHRRCDLGRMAILRRILGRYNTEVHIQLLTTTIVLIINLTLAWSSGSSSSIYRIQRAFDLQCPTFTQPFTTHYTPTQHQSYHGCICFPWSPVCVTRETPCQKAKEAR